MSDSPCTHWPVQFKIYMSESAGHSELRGASGATRSVKEEIGITLGSTKPEKEQLSQRDREC